MALDGVFNTEKKKQGLASFDDFDEARHSGPARYASSAIFLFSRKAEDVSNEFPSKLLIYVFFFYFLFVRAACMASDFVRCFCGRSYLGVLTNYLAFLFFFFSCVCEYGIIGSGR
jgi:hypothetical protein